MLSTLILSVVLASGMSGGAWIEQPKGPDFGEDSPAYDFRTFRGQAELKLASYKTLVGVNIGVFVPPRDPDKWTIIASRWRPSGSEFDRAAANGFSIVWQEPPTGYAFCAATDSVEECTAALDTACAEAGHGGVSGGSVTLAEGTDGCMTCSGDCTQHSAVAFITEMLPCGGPTVPDDPAPDPDDIF